MRKEGYYWVKYFGDWTISEWDGEHWGIAFSGMRRRDSDMDEIDENRIERMPKLVIGKAYTRDEFQAKYGKKPPQYLSDNPYLCEE